MDTRWDEARWGKLDVMRVKSISNWPRIATFQLVPPRLMAHAWFYSAAHFALWWSKARRVWLAIAYQSLRFHSQIAFDILFYILYNLPIIQGRRGEARWVEAKWHHYSLHWLRMQIHFAHARMSGDLASLISWRVNLPCGHLCILPTTYVVP